MSFFNYTDEKNFNLVKIKYGAIGKEKTALISDKEFYSNNLHSKISGFFKNPACSNKIASELIRRLALGCGIKNFYNHYEHQGWQYSTDEHSIFACSPHINDEHFDIFPEGIKRRKLRNSIWDDCTVIRKFEELLNCLHWKLKVLLIFNIVSIILFFFKGYDISPKEMFTLIPSDGVSDLNNYLYSE